MKVVLASGNHGKLKELAAMLAAVGMDLVSQSELGIEGAAEDGLTFVENAIAKARHVCKVAQLPALADDSGLVVPCLDGRPGIRSARYAGEAATDAANNARLLADIAGHSLPPAHFYCALVYLRHAADPAPLIATASWHGQIVADARGAFGFGYDPHFLVSGLNRTAAEMAPEEKNRLSHRGQASAQLLQMLQHSP
jgi:XTP/dITP diphosphohydrolase